MKVITSEEEYNAALARIEELLHLVNDETPLDDKNLIELDLLSGLVSDYEDIHYPVPYPSGVGNIQIVNDKN